MAEKEYKTVTRIEGPLVFVEKTEPIGYEELVSVRLFVMKKSARLMHCNLN